MAACRHGSIAPGVRLVFLIPALRRDSLSRWLSKRVERARPEVLARWLMGRHWSDDQVWGGTLNILRHCDVARSAGADAVVATTDGEDGYGDVFGDGRRFEFIPWARRRPDDVCILPDFASRLADTVRGRVIVYEQSPLHLRNDFDATRANLMIWTDSPFMQAKCAEWFPGKPSIIVPNVVDERMFPFVPQARRTPGLLFAFPRKNPDFIAASEAAYREAGGTYWRFEPIDGLPIAQLARRFREPQAFLASAANEGCALPPQEAMAAGVAVIGRSANGANYCMQDEVTSLNAETPAQAAAQLRRLEDRQLRERLVTAGRELISRYFPDAEPRRFWEARLEELQRH